MDKIKKLSEAIRYGSTFLGETKSFCDEDFKCGCAVGTAYLAVIDGSPKQYPGGEVMMRALSKRFNVPYDVVGLVSHMHFYINKSRAECADWLEARGY